MKHALHLMILTLGIFVMTCYSHDCNAATKGAAPEQFKRIMDTTYVTESGCTVEKFRLHSPSMERDIKVAIVLPPAYKTDQSRKFPILYTLHGSGAPYDTYAAMSILQAQLKDKPFIYTCFDGDDHSMFLDAKFPMVTARKSEKDTIKRKSLFDTFFFAEFIPAIDSWYRVDINKRGLTGFSMGGFGALHYALVHPEMFCSVSGLSSVFMESSTIPDWGRNMLQGILGPIKENRAAYEAVDHYKRLAVLKATGVAIPPIYLACGTEDGLLKQSRKMKGYMDSLHIPSEYREAPGIHNWIFWHAESVGIAEFHWKYFIAKEGKEGSQKNKDEGKSAKLPVKENKK
jgi:S-formylglutathione hydrolase FrmB